MGAVFTSTQSRNASSLASSASITVPRPACLLPEALQGRRCASAWKDRRSMDTRCKVRLPAQTRARSARLRGDVPDSVAICVGYNKLASTDNACNDAVTTRRRTFEGCFHSVPPMCHGSRRQVKASSRQETRCFPCTSPPLGRNLLNCAAPVSYFFL